MDLIKYTLLQNPAAPGTISNQPAVPREEIYCPLSKSLSTPYGKSLRPRQAKRVSPSLPLGLALLSWIDTNSASPNQRNLQQFQNVVNDTITKLALPDSIVTPTILQDFIKGLEPTNLSGVAAVVGGVIGQDVLNALGGKELPIKNWLVFDGKSCEGRIYNLMGDTSNGIPV